MRTPGWLIAAASRVPWLRSWATRRIRVVTVVQPVTVAGIVLRRTRHSPPQVWHALDIPSHTLDRLMLQDSSDPRDGGEAAER